MSSKEKLIERAKNNPRGLKFEEFRQLLSSHNWVQDRQTGSHQIWYSPDRQRISIQNRNGQAKEYQVKQFLAIHFNEGYKNE
ncbi:MAG: type II toxin-antitoxin system HicA family toxin [Gammaproteobacteria bacterium]